MVAILQFVDDIEWWSKYGSYPSICYAIEWWSKYGSYPFNLLMLLNGGVNMVAIHSIC